MDPEIRAVLLFTNDFVAVLNHAGDQMPDYQGLHADVVDLVLAEAPLKATFEYVEYEPTAVHIGLTRAQFRRGMRQ